MNKSKLLLMKMTELIPPNGEMRHNLTLNGNSLELTLMIKGKFISFLLDDSDMERDIISLTQDLFVAAKKELKKIDADTP